VDKNKGFVSPALTGKFLFKRKNYLANFHFFLQVFVNVNINKQALSKAHR
jgi:hypothetical protein